MDLPVIDTPIFPRWVWMEEITYSHIPIATMITAFMVLAPIIEYIGYRKNDLRYDRMSKGFIWFAMILFSPGAALGTGIPVFIIGAYPEFWSRWSNLFFWPLMLQFVFFLCEVFFLFFFYYLTWDAWMKRKRLHIIMGAIAAMFGLLVQAVWDSLGGYMLTTGGVDLPGVEEPVAWSAAAFFNPSFPFLFAHRFVGNISYVMLLVGGVFALRYMGTKSDKENKAYLGWAADWMFTLGLLSFFLMPLIGWFYARVIQANAPIAFSAIMGGHAAPHFTVKMALIMLFVVIGGAYLFVRHKSSAVPVAITVGLAALSVVILAHPPLDWLGVGQDALWRGVCIAVLGGLIGLFWLMRGRVDTERNYWRWLKFIAGLAAFFAFTLGGFVRERSKSPDTVYGEIVKPEVTQMEADRYLLYDKCASWHNAGGPSPKDFERYEGKDWPQRVQAERTRPGAPTITDDEAQRIIRFLEEHYP